MDPAVVVSPHMDDAVLSVGQWLAGRPDAHVITVFTGAPEDPTVLTTYDRDCRFRSAGQAIAAREREDQIALSFLNATGAHLGFLDHQYRTTEADGIEVAAAEAIVHEVSQLAERTAAPFPMLMLGPLGLKHPDHHITRRAVQSAARHLGDLVQLWLYEDAPARVLWPEDVAEALAWWRGMGWDLVLDFLGTGSIGTKERAVRIYGSQLWALDLHAVLCPERIWRAWPCS